MNHNSMIRKIVVVKLTENISMHNCWSQWFVQSSFFWMSGRSAEVPVKDGFDEEAMVNGQDTSADGGANGESQNTFEYPIGSKVEILDQWVSQWVATYSTIKPKTSWISHTSHNDCLGYCTNAATFDEKPVAPGQLSVRFQGSKA